MAIKINDHFNDKNKFKSCILDNKLEINSSAPVILWLNGGPGASSLIGLFNELGPYVVQKDLNLTKREYAWTDEYSVLFVDNPVGAETDEDESLDYYKNYLRLESTMKKLHVGNHNFSDGTLAGSYLKEDIPKSMAKELASVVKNYKVNILLVMVNKLV
ncbi:hypothetical protein RND71_043864 [Anisodus tanguticus]|uniref:Serine carboxypeptidase n=1 Tax=Anisodus tanguticus TaxID=243964 RepID=A0AAE1QR74_9SOLA|nr:hypothetical protein RND71_043864 [Anisodus tanguticus]